MKASLRDAPGEETKETPKKATRDALCGTTVSTAHRYRSENHEKCIFVFSDLSSRKEGYFQLLFELYFLDTVANEAVFLKEILSDTFRVYPMKTYPGVRSSTSLTRHMGEQGIRLRVRKDTKLYGAARGKKPLSADGSAQRTRLPSSQLLSLPRSMSTSSEGAMYQPPPPSSLLSSQLPLSSWDQDIQERPTQRRRTDSASVLAISSTSAEAEEAGQLTFRGPGYMDQDGREADPHEGSSALGPQPYYQSNLATHPPTDHIYQFQGQQPGPYDPIYPVYGFDPSGHGMVEPSMELAEPTPGKS